MIIINFEKQIKMFNLVNNLHLNLLHLKFINNFREILISAFIINCQVLLSFVVKHNNKFMYTDEMFINYFSLTLTLITTDINSKHFHIKATLIRVINA